MALGEVFLQCLVDEEADHGLGDAGVGRGQAPVEAPDPLRLVNIAGTLQCVHLLLSPGSEEDNQVRSVSRKQHFKTLFPHKQDLFSSNV